jgi:hypothetical protein
MYRVQGSLTYVPLIKEDTCLAYPRLSFPSPANHIHSSICATFRVKKYFYFFKDYESYKFYSYLLSRWLIAEIGDLGAIRATEEDPTASESAISRKHSVYTFNVAGATTVRGADSHTM